MPTLSADPEHAATPAIPPAYLELVYPLPRDPRSLDDGRRRLHRDLPDLTDEDLALEAFRVLLRMCFERDDDAMTWLRERRHQVRAELDLRRHIDPLQTLVAETIDSGGSLLNEAPSRWGAARTGVHPRSEAVRM